MCRVQYEVTFLELYNEEITDLLAPDESKFPDDKSKKPIALMEDGKGGVFVRGLEEEVVRTASEIYRILEKGSAKRRTAETLLTSFSSAHVHPAIGQQMLPLQKSLIGSDQNLPPSLPPHNPLLSSSNPQTQALQAPIQRLGQIQLSQSIGHNPFNQGLLPQQFPGLGGQLSASSSLILQNATASAMQNPLGLQQHGLTSVPSQQQLLSTNILPQVLSSKGRGRSSSSPLVPISSPSKVSIAPTKASSLGLGEHKTGMEDDFFWAPLKQSKEGSRSDFPSLANNPSSQNVKGTPPVKGVQGEGSIKKASSSKPVEHSITSSPAISKSLSKGKKDVESKYSEAMGFRCEGEWLRLTGTNDTSFLEFCLTQPTTEAASLLRENLVSLDHNHVFIDKFINYMEFLSSEIIKIAFQSRKNSKTSSENQPRASHETRILRNVDAEADGVEGSNKGKKKGKKGKKLSSSLLGFNVVSNRIMMGEIQTIED